MIWEKIYSLPIADTQKKSYSLPDRYFTNSLFDIAIIIRYYSRTTPLTFAAYKLPLGKYDRGVPPLSEVASSSTLSLQLNTTGHRFSDAQNPSDF